MVGQIIKNTNGLSYEVLGETKKVTLLEPLNNKYDKYVVAIGLKKYDTGYSWEHGSYLGENYNTKKAFEVFCEKVMQQEK